jgi:hypothetical protein
LRRGPSLGLSRLPTIGPRMSAETDTAPHAQLRIEIMAAVDYPLRHSEIEDFRYETMIENLMQLVLRREQEAAR